MESIEEQIRGIVKAVDEGDVARLEKCSIDLSITLLHYDDFPRALFEGLLDIIQHSAFQRMEGSYVLLNNVLFDNLNNLSSIQKKELVNVLEVVYDKLQDSTTCMLVLEIIVNLFPNEVGLNILCRLATTKTEVPRAMVAYGLYYFIKEFPDAVMAGRALDELRKMKSDPSQIVQKEVGDALLKLK